MDVEQLRGLFLFEGLDDDQLGQVLAAGEEIPFDEGTVLFREGEPAEAGGCCCPGASISCAVPAAAILSSC